MNTIAKQLAEMAHEIQSSFKIVGRDKELKKALAAKIANKHLLLEGEVGVGKTTLAMAIGNYFSQELYRIDGDDRAGPSKLVGYFDPPMVIDKGYNWQSFVTGPLTRAMLDGQILFLNELNRLPEETQNTLLPAMDEYIVYIPKLGEINAVNGFYIIATQNPEEHVGTTPLGEAIRDRFVWIKLDYQSEEEEEKIVETRTGCSDPEIVKNAVSIVRATREHSDIRRGSSVRGAIDLTAIIMNYEETDIQTWIDTAIMALATKIELEDGVEKSIEDVITQIVREYFKNFVK